MKLVELIQDSCPGFPEYEVSYSNVNGTKEVYRFSVTEDEGFYILGFTRTGKKFKAKNFERVQTSKEARQKLYQKAEKFARRLSKKHKTKINTF